MKRMILKYILAVLTLSLVATLVCCDTAPQEQPTEKQVWLATTYIHHREDSKGKYVYNEYGNMIRNENYDLYDQYKGTWLYEYDEHQNLIQRAVDTGKDAPFVQLINTYDENGRLVKEQQFWSGDGVTYTYRYDKQGRLAAKLLDGKAVQVYTHTEDGYRMESVSDPAIYSIYNKDGHVIEQYNGGVRAVCTYNEDGKLIGISYFAYPEGDPMYSYLYELDEHGNNTKIYRVGSDGEKVLYSEFTYEQFTVKVLPES